MNNNRYLPFALVALVASVLGWGASTYMNRETTNAMVAANQAAALGLQTNQPAANFQPVAPLALAPLSQQALAPVAAAPAVPAEQVVTVREAPRSVVRTAPVRSRSASVEHEAASAPMDPAPVRKKGMSNKTKTAIAIGGAAGVGAAIGGIAGGGKGAAIGAIAGAGAGTVYSVIRHKQNKPVF